MKPEIQVGSKVRCLSGDIDKDSGKGEIGIVEGFARFSNYHELEARVCVNGCREWFWLSSLERLG